MLTLTEMFLPVIIGFVAAVIAYVIYRRKTIAVWAYLAAFFPDLPILVLKPLGAAGLDNTLLLTHTIGLFVFPIILVIVDILLIELKMISLLKPLGPILPKNIKKALRIERLIERFQDYGAIPSPIRVSTVYIVGVMAGLIHLVINLLTGTLY